MGEPAATIALLAVPETTASTLYGMYDLFGATGRDWELLVHGRSGPSLLNPCIVSRDGQGFRTANGAWIQPDGALADLPAPVAICIPDLLVAPEEPLAGRSFKRRFKQATGMTPMDYVHTLRLEEAKQILESGDAPIDEVAEQVGYADPSFFRALFRRRVGLTPSHYRRRFRGMRLRLQ